jgi:hypothetical protein
MQGHEAVDRLAKRVRIAKRVLELGLPFKVKTWGLLGPGLWGL